MPKSLSNYKFKSGTSHTTTLFHYTQTWKKILSILENGLFFSYSYDNLGSVFLALPMISFCDIPLSRNQEHTGRYGNFAIGISKDALLNKYPSGYWGPVNYIFNSAIVNLAFWAREQYSEKKNKYDKFIDDRLKSPIDDPIGHIETDKGNVTFSLDEFMPLSELETSIDNLNKSFCYTLGFVKPFDGFNKKGKKQYNYDECEWRIILPEGVKLLNGNLLKWIFSQEEYNEWRGKHLKPKPRVDYSPFTFQPEQLRFIVIKSDSSLAKCVKDIRNLKRFCGQPITEDIKDVLCSKLISQEQISKDI